MALGSWIAQAAAGAILTVALADDTAGITRLLDALLGAGVALVFSQLLFSPEPVRLLRAAETAALEDLARGLELVAAGLEQDDDELGEQAISRLRDMRDRLSELSRARRVGSRVARRSAVWRGQQGPVVRETENAGHLDLLAGSCLMLARTATVAGPSRRGEPASRVRELARALGDLADDLGARDARQDAADRALAVVRGLDHAEPTSDAEIAQLLAMTRTVAADVMTFAGVDAEEAVAAVRKETGQVEVADPPSAARHPLTLPGTRPWSRVATSALAVVAAASSAVRRRRR